MRVYYDYQVLLNQQFGGVSRYFYEIIRRLEDKKDYNISVTIKCIGSINYYFQEILGKKKREESCKFNQEIIDKIYRRINKGYSKWLLRKPYDIIHPTYYDPYLLDHYKGKLVVTIHDMIHEIFPDSFVQWNRDVKRKMALAADHIVAVSECTKKDILKYYPDIKEKNISVIPHASSLIVIPGCKRIIKNKYILYVGTRNSYKNFTKFFEAIKPILLEESKLQLVCAGGGEYNVAEREMIGSLAERCIHINADDITLSSLYTYAECFVFPSLYEGFGIPLLEAFSCKCPVIASNTSSLPEVAGDGAIYFDPYDVVDIQSKIKMVLYDEKLKTALIEKGISRLRGYDWNKSTEMLVQCYESLLEK